MDAYINAKLQDLIQDIIHKEYYLNKMTEIIKNSPQNSYTRRLYENKNYRYLLKGISLQNEDILTIFKRLETDEQFFKELFGSAIVYSSFLKEYLQYHKVFKEIFFNNNISEKEIEKLYNFYIYDNTLSKKENEKNKNKKFINFIYSIQSAFYALGHPGVFGVNFCRIKELGVNNICTYDQFRKAVSTFLNNNKNILLGASNLSVKHIEITDYTDNFDNDFCCKLLEKNKIYPKVVLYNHKFTENDIIYMLEKCNVFKNKSSVMGGIQQQRQNACNHIIKSQVVTTKILHKILDSCFSDDESLFLKSLDKKSILIKNLELDDELVSKMVTAGVDFKKYDITKLSEESQLLIELNK